MATLPSDIAARPVIDNTVEDVVERPPAVLGGFGFADVTERISRVNENRPPIIWWFLLAFSATWMAILGGLIGYLFLTGVGVWGNNIPAAWGFPIVNFVFWIGIGHAGTLISAILCLFRQKWRTSINRFAEAMTIFAVICALVWPGIHIGRPWLPFWMAPYPNQMGMWPQFRSPLLWDVFAVSTYFTVSLLFWYMGMLPDLASLRDRARLRGACIASVAYGVLSLGWTGANRHWHRYERAYLILAALATPLVLSVHSVVSFDFATSQLPGWHTTIFPPYFVAGAVFGGFAMVMLLAIPAREIFGLKEVITVRHMENMAKITLATGSIVGLAYSTEAFIAWYSHNPYEGFTFMNRAFGPYAWSYWLMFSCNVFIPQTLWVKKWRCNMKWLFVVSAVVTVGMWFERFVIIITSLTRDFVPSSWGMYVPTWVDICMLMGSFGLFFTLFLLFLRFLPMVNMAEVKTCMPQAHAHHNASHGAGHGFVDQHEGEQDEEAQA
ncbi:MAG: hydrogenase [Phycisphaera sp.]|nr:hydrogenase [Phycisphaera sp.]